MAEEVVQEPLEEVTVDAEKKSATPLSYPGKGGGSPDPRLQGIAKFKVFDGKENEVLLSPEIILPLPEDLSYGDAADYSNADLGSMGAQFADQNLSNAFTSAIEDIKAGGASEIGLSVLSRYSGNRTRSRIGKTPNPNTRALFKQVNMRSFEFSYKFVPTSWQEAREVKRIVKAFRSELYPTDASGTDEDGFKIAYAFPNRYRIKFFLGSEEEGRFEIEPKLKFCFLTAVNVKYNTKTILREGAGGTTGKLDFADTSLSLSFRESETLLSEEIHGGGF